VFIKDSFIGGGARGNTNSNWCSLPSGSIWYMQLWLALFTKYYWCRADSSSVCLLVCLSVYVVCLGHAHKLRWHRRSEAAGRAIEAGRPSSFRGWNAIPIVIGAPCPLAVYNLSIAVSGIFVTSDVTSHRSKLSIVLFHKHFYVHIYIYIYI